MVALSNAEITSLLFDEQGSNPGTPSAGYARLFAKDGSFKTIDDAGLVTSVGGELDYVEFTSPVSPTATTEATADTLVTATAITFDGATVVMVQFYAPYVRPATGTTGRQLSLYLYDGASSIGRIGLVVTPATGDGTYVPVRVERRLTPSAASHTYSVRAAVSAGTGYVSVGGGGAGADMPGFIRIVRV